MQIPCNMKIKKLDDNFKDPNMQIIELIAISPIAYSLLKEGEILRIELKEPKKNEYREKIGPAIRYHLVMKGITKIGMIPTAFLTKNPTATTLRKCRVLKINKDKNIIAVAVKI